MSDAASRFLDQEGIYSIDGRSGLENLALLCKGLGYEDTLNQYGQFVKERTGQYGQLGDIFEFLEDNPGAIQAIFDWVDEQNIPEWDELIPEEEEEEEEEDDES